MMTYGKCVLRTRWWEWLVARRLVVDDDAPELTRKDRLALALAPRIRVDIDYAGCSQSHEPRADDPITAPLDDSSPRGVVTTRLSCGPPRTDAPVLPVCGRCGHRLTGASRSVTRRAERSGVG
jgi:hypothetical protein